MTDSATYLSQLHQLLNQHFDLAEVRTLCLDLNIDYESVAGQEKSSRIRELLLALGRNGRLPELISLAKKLRPLVDWPPLPDDFEMPESLSSANTNIPVKLYRVDAESSIIGTAIGDGASVKADVIAGGDVNIGYTPEQLASIIREIGKETPPPIENVLSNYLDAAIQEWAYLQIDGGSHVPLTDVFIQLKAVNSSVSPLV